jgi:hypothetical protein
VVDDDTSPETPDVGGAIEVGNAEGVGTSVLVDGRATEVVVEGDVVAVLEAVLLELVLLEVVLLEVVVVDVVGHGSTTVLATEPCNEDPVVTGTEVDGDVEFDVDVDGEGRVVVVRLFTGPEGEGPAVAG